MRKWLLRGGWRLVVVGGVVASVFGGCDPTTLTAVENGVITASSSLLAAFLQAITQLMTQAASTTTTTTAQAIVDVASRVLT
jgi:hypothetical protein